MTTISLSTRVNLNRESSFFLEFDRQTSSKTGCSEWPSYIVCKQTKQGSIKTMTKNDHILIISITKCAPIIISKTSIQIMSQQPRFNVQAAISSEINMRPYSSKALFPSKNDLNNLDSELNKRRRDALAAIRETRLKDASSRAGLFEQQRRNAKQLIFQKYYQIIQKELEILKIQMVSQNEFYQADSEFFRLSNYSSTTYKLSSFQINLQAMRSSTCYFKYCCPQQDRCCCCLQWFFCWCTLPFYCCYRRCLYQSKSHARLQQLYERYEQLMVAENQAVACPHN